MKAEAGKRGNPMKCSMKKLVMLGLAAAAGAYLVKKRKKAATAGEAPEAEVKVEEAAQEAAEEKE